MVTGSFQINLWRNIAMRHVKVANSSAIAICTTCQSANKAYVKVIEVYRKMVFILSQLTCLNIYNK